MLSSLAKWSKQRSAWLVLALSATVLLGLALYFQYQMNLQPCMLCVYARAALTGVILAALIALISPTNGLLRWIALFTFAASSVWGFMITQEHIGVEELVQSGGLYTCSLFPEFPLGLPLDKWFPEIFNPTGMCGDVAWRFMDLSMPVWTRVIFVVYCLLALMLIFSQFKKKKYNPYD
jgi:disulfide bond formation protein DsbB